MSVVLVPFLVLFFGLCLGFFACLPVVLALLAPFLHLLMWLSLSLSLSLLLSETDNVQKRITFLGPLQKYGC